jgi:hypothetical protein
MRYADPALPAAVEIFCGTIARVVGHLLLMKMPGWPWNASLLRFHFVALL